MSLFVLGVTVGSASDRLFLVWCGVEDTSRWSVSRVGTEWSLGDLW